MNIMARILDKGEEDYDICKLQEFVKNIPEIRHCGAIYSFEGIVRGEDSGRITHKIVLSTANKENCQKELLEIIKNIKDKYGVIGIGVIHFIGEFKVGETLFLAVVAGAHRQETQKALYEIIERVKYELDFKKEEKTDAGTNIIMSGG